MLEACFENVAPYIEHLDKLKKFVEENRERSPEEIIEILEGKIDEASGTLRTDYVILLNEVKRFINMEKKVV